MQRLDRHAYVSISVCARVLVQSLPLIEFLGVLKTLNQSDSFPLPLPSFLPSSLPRYLPAPSLLCVSSVCRNSFRPWHSIGSEVKEVGLKMPLPEAYFATSVAHASPSPAPAFDAAREGDERMIAGRESLVTMCRSCEHHTPHGV
jgi:hypothetical protein